MMRGRHRRTSTAPPGPQTIRDEPCHILPRRSPSQVPMISPRATPPPKKTPECGSVELSRRFPPPSPPLSGQVDPFDFAGGEKNVGEECAEPTVLISRCHGPAFPSPQSRDHTTAYRCREARCQALRSPVLPPLPRSSGSDPSHLPFRTNMSRSRCLEINRQAPPFLHLLLLIHAHARTMAISHLRADGKGSRVPLRGVRVRGGGAAACVRRKAALAMHLSIIVEDARVSPSAGSTSPRGDQCAQTAFKGRVYFKRAPEQHQIFSGCTRILPRGQAPAVFSVGRNDTHENLYCCSYSTYYKKPPLQ